MNDKTDFLRVDASESIFDLERVTKDIMAAFSGRSNKMRIMIFTNLRNNFVYTNNSVIP